MADVDKLEEEVQKLSHSELAEFRKWFHEYDAEKWDRQIEDDIQTGRLNRLAQKALADHRTGKTREL